MQIGHPQIERALASRDRSIDLDETLDTTAIKSQ